MFGMFYNEPTLLGAYEPTSEGEKISLIVSPFHLLKA